MVNMLFARDETVINPLTATPETLMVVVSNYTCMSITICVLLARAAFNAKWRRRFGVDDILMMLSLVRRTSRYTPQSDTNLD